MRASAYASVLDDWNLLVPALSTIADRVDEIVVVDGAYRWMAPFLAAVGRDPLRSRPEMYDALSKFGSKIRVVNGLWENESEKRAAGYEACRGRYVIRCDADEVLFWNDTEMDRFLASGKAVGQMEMPLYVAPGLIRAIPGGSGLERQSFFFDREKIGAWDHLSYLWLVTTPAERARFKPRRDALVHGTPLAFNAHLTHWRQPDTAVSRARFYVLNFIRSTGGLPWLPGYSYTDDSFEGLLRILPPEVFNDFLLGHPIVACPPSIAGSSIAPSPRSALDEASFAMLYDDMLASLARLNDTLASTPRHIVSGQAYHMDASRPDSLAAMRAGDGLAVRFSQPAAASKVTLTTLHVSGSTQSVEVESALHQTSLRFSIPPMPGAGSGVLRRSLALSVWPRDKTVYIQFQARIA